MGMGGMGGGMGGGMFAVEDELSLGTKQSSSQDYVIEIAIRQPNSNSTVHLPAAGGERPD
jgi:hypothetical protein